MNSEGHSVRAVLEAANPIQRVEHLRKIDGDCRTLHQTGIKRKYQERVLDLELCPSTQPRTVVRPAKLILKAGGGRRDGLCDAAGGPVGLV